MRRHGRFAARVAGGQETDCMDGYTIWHLIAAGLYSQMELGPFLIQTTSIAPDTLLDDLGEVMTVFPHVCAWRHAIPSFSPQSWEELRALTAFRTPREICRLRKTPFLAEYHVEKEWMHPVVEAFRRQTLKDLNLREWDVPPIQ